jgi:hypothetical protein
MQLISLSLVAKLFQLKSKLGLTSPPFSSSSLSGISFIKAGRQKEELPLNRLQFDAWTNSLLQQPRGPIATKFWG